MPIAFDQVNLIRIRARLQVRRRHSDQAIALTRGLGFQQGARGSEQARRQLRRRQAGAAARAQFEIGRAQFQSDAGRRQPCPLQPLGDAFAEAEQRSRKLGGVADIVLEGDFRRDALGLAFGRDAPIIDAVGEAPEPSAVFAQTRDGLRWLERLQFADHAEADS